MKNKFFLLAILFLAFSATPVSAQFSVYGISKKIASCNDTSKNLKRYDVLTASSGGTTIKLFFKEKNAFVDILDPRILNAQGKKGIWRLKLTNPNSVKTCITFKLTVLGRLKSATVLPRNSASADFIGYEVLKLIESPEGDTK